MMSLTHMIISEPLNWLGDMLNLEILNAEQINLIEKNTKSVIDIEILPIVREWLNISINSDFQKKLQDYQEFLRKLLKNMKKDILVAKCYKRVHFYKSNFYENDFRSM